MMYLKTHNLYRLVAIIFLSLFIFLTRAQDFEQIQKNITKFQTDKDTLNLARSWYKMGKYHYQQNKIEESNKALKIALFWAKSLNNPNAILVISNYLATNFSFIGKSDSSLHYYKVAINACVLSGDQLKKVNILINYGSELASTGNYSEAAQYALEAVKIKEGMNDSTDLAFVYRKVGEIYKQAGETDKWKEYVQKAYRIKDDEKCTRVHDLAAIYNDLGGIAEKNRKYEEALLYYDTLISIGRKYNNENAIHVAMSNSATIYKLLGDLPKAFDAAIKAQQYKAADVYHRLYNDNLLAELYLTTSNLSEAIKYVKLAIQNENINNYPDEKMRAFKTFFEIEKKNHHFKEALSWNEKYKALSDSLRSKEIRTQIVKMDITYQTEKKEQQIELLSVENQIKNQRIVLFIAISISLLLLLVVGIMLYFRNVKQNLQRQEMLKQQLLRSQMNPHFLFNALGSIQNFMLKNETKKAAGYLNNFASLTRNILEQSNQEFVSISDEVDTLRNYMELEKMRLQNSFDFDITYDKDLEIDLIHIPPMLIQPFVENAIKHGLNNIDYKGLLELKFEEKDAALHIEIVDNGVGIERGQENKSTLHRSMSMNIFEQRRIVLSKRIKQAIGLEICDRRKINPLTTGTLVKIEIPILN